MDRASAIAFVVLILSGGGGAWADPGPAAKTVARKPAARKAAVRRTSGSYVVSGVSLWQERVQIVRESDHRVYRAQTSTFTFGLGVQTKLYRPGWGWQFSGQAFAGRNSTQSQDPQLTYFYNHDLVYGIAAAAGAYTIIGKPAVRLAAEFSPLYRHVNYKRPEGFSFVPYNDRILLLGRVEAAFPLTASVELVQQVGFALGGREVIWYMGLRL